MGRLVITHSSYIDGLIEVLKKVSKIKNIQTVTPGVLKKARGKSEHLRIKVSIKTIGGFKLIARKGSMTQEVFVITKVDQKELQKMIENVLKNH